MAEKQEIPQRLELAMQQQRRSVKAYELMLATPQSKADRALLLAMRREERRHYYLLEGVYEELTGHAFRPASLQLSLPRQYPSMLKVMICDKLETIDFYAQLAADIRCVKQRELLEIIVSDQKEQARILAAIYRRSED